MPFSNTLVLQSCPRKSLETVGDTLPGWMLFLTYVIDNYQKHVRQPPNALRGIKYDNLLTNNTSENMPNKLKTFHKIE